MNTQNTYEEIYAEYQRALRYNLSCDYYNKVAQFENFYMGKQWEGINAPELDKPVLNFIKRVCTFLCAMIVSEDISVYISPFIHTLPNQTYSEILTKETEKIVENTKLKSLCRQAVKNAVITGDGILYWYYAGGQINGQVLQSKNVLFGNPFQNDVQKQPYILVEKQEYFQDVVYQAKKNKGQPDLLKPDQNYTYEKGEPEMVTTITKFYKLHEAVWAVKSTKDGLVHQPICLEYRLYPFAKISWDIDNDSYHAVGVVEGLIPNQIAVNKLWAMALMHQKAMAFPKIFFDKTKIDAWTNKVGAAIGVMGNPNEAVATSFKSADMSEQVLAIVEKTISYTKEFMGANDNSLGNVDPTNTSAIMAVQRTATVPLEIQKQAFSQLLEDCVLIMAQMMAINYQKRMIEVVDEQGNYCQQIFDFSSMDYDQMHYNIETSCGGLWAESLQAQTLQDLYMKGIFTDAAEYVQAIPSNQLKNKQRILKLLQSQPQPLQKVQASLKKAEPGA